jgi:hypothetical protein
MGEKVWQNIIFIHILCVLDFLKTITTGFGSYRVDLKLSRLGYCKLKYFVYLYISDWIYKTRNVRITTHLGVFSVHFCHPKAVLITYPQNEPGALVIQHEKRIYSAQYYIVFCGLSGFSISRWLEKFIYTKCVLIFYKNLSATIVIKSRIEPDIHVKSNVHRSWTSILSDDNETWISKTDSPKPREFQISWKFVQ